MNRVGVEPTTSDQLSTLLSTTYLNGQPLWYTFGLKSWKIEMHNYIKEYWWIN